MELHKKLCKIWGIATAVGVLGTIAIVVGGVLLGFDPYLCVIGAVIYGFTVVWFAIGAEFKALDDLT